MFPTRTVPSDITINSQTPPLIRQFKLEVHHLKIAATFSVPVSAVQKQLLKFEEGGVLVSNTIGRTRLYTWNPRYPFQEKLRSLLAESFRFMPEDEIQAYYRQRRRPRRADKPP